MGAPAVRNHREGGGPDVRPHSRCLSPFSSGRLCRSVAMYQGERVAYVGGGSGEGEEHVAYVCGGSEQLADLVHGDGESALA